MKELLPPCGMRTTPGPHPLLTKKVRGSEMGPGLGWLGSARLFWGLQREECNRHHGDGSRAPFPGKVTRWCSMQVHHSCQRACRRWAAQIVIVLTAAESPFTRTTPTPGPPCLDTRLKVVVVRMLRSRERAPPSWPVTTPCRGGMGGGKPHLVLVISKIFRRFGGQCSPPLAKGSALSLPRTHAAGELCAPPHSAAVQLPPAPTLS